MDIDDSDTEMESYSTKPSARNRIFRPRVYVYLPSILLLSAASAFETCQRRARSQPLSAPREIKEMTACVFLRNQ
eukprot:2009233-Rhodomonas_salina.1